MPELKILYDDAPPGAAEATTVTATGAQVFSNFSAMLADSNTIPQVATLEDDYWKLGSSFRFFPATPTGLNWGLWSDELCDEDGYFDNQPVLTLKLNALFSMEHFSMEFDAYGPTWCSLLAVTWYRDDEMLLYETYSPSGWCFVADAEVENFDKIVIRFIRMSHGLRFLKLQRFSYGAAMAIRSDELSDVHMFRECDLISDTLPVGTFEFSVHKSENSHFMFQRRQMISVMHGNKLIGRFYVADTVRRRKKIEVHAVNVFGLLDMASKSMGGMYNGSRAFEVVDEIVGGTAICHIDLDIAGTEIYGYLPIADRRENLRQLAFAIGACVVDEPDGSIRLKSVPSTATSTVENSRVYDNCAISDDPKVTDVKLSVYAYAPDPDADRTTLFEQSLTGYATVEFPEPMSDLSIVNGTIIRSNVNYAYIVSTGLQVKLTGVAYKRTEISVGIAKPLTNANDAENSVSYDGMTLVTKENAEDILSLCLDRAVRTEKIENKILLNDENVGDLVSIHTDEGVRIGHIISMDYTISSKLAANIVLLAGEEGDEA